MASKKQKTDYQITLGKGLWSLRLQNGLLLEKLGISILTEREQLSSTDRECDMCAGENEIFFRFPGWEACIRLTEVNDSGIVYDFRITNRTEEVQRIRTVTPVFYAGKWNDEGAFTVSGDTRVLTLPAERAYGDDGPKDVSESRMLVSFWGMAFHDPSAGKNFLAGICDVSQGFVRYKCTPLLAVKKEGVRVLQWACEVDLHSGVRGVRLEPGASIDIGAQCLSLWEGALTKGLEAYGDRLGERFGRRNGERAPSGWCSWYAGYYENITEEEILKNLAVCKENPELEFFQVDMGWENEVGTKKLGEPGTDLRKFPHGMKWMARQIAESGLKPGIWIRPFIGWTGKDENIPVWARGECIDLSHPDARKWIALLAGTLTKDWGYRYIKFDFVTYDFLQKWGTDLPYSALAPFKPYDDSLTNARMYRLGLEALREGAGEDCFLLGCNCMTGPALGIIDGNRMGDDVNEENWDKTYTMGVKCVSPAYFLNRRLWSNDPDCIMLQEPMTPQHVKMWGSLVSIAGQMGILSTKMYALPADRMKFMKKLLPVLDIHARPLDMARSNSPEIWYGAVSTPWEDYTVVAAFHWRSGRRVVEIGLEELALPQGQYTAFEFWSQKFWGVCSGALRIAFSGEGCQVIALRRNDGRPRVVGTDRHILQGKLELAGERWDEEACRLHIGIEEALPFDISVYVPEGYVPAGKALKTGRSPEIAAVSSREARDGELVLQFTKETT